MPRCPGVCSFVWSLPRQDLLGLIGRTLQDDPVVLIRDHELRHELRELVDVQALVVSVHDAQKRRLGEKGKGHPASHRSLDDEMPRCRDARGFLLQLLEMPPTEQS